MRKVTLYCKMVSKSVQTAHTYPYVNTQTQALHHNHRKYQDQANGSHTRAYRVSIYIGQNCDVPLSQML
jgi:hypothetical protein